MQGLFGGAVSSLTAAPSESRPAPSAQNPAASAAAAAPSASQAAPSGSAQDDLIRQAARDLADYQRLTAEGKLGEAGQKLESLKQTLEQLNRARR